MSKTKELDKKSPFQGSIDARIDPVFEEDHLATKVDWWYEDNAGKIEGELTLSCFTEGIKQVFKRVDNLDFKIVQKEKTILKSAHPEFEFNKMVYNGPNHVRIYFSGVTPSDFEGKRKEIEAFLDKQSISHKMYCPWVCPENAKQHELTSKFLTDFEKLR